MSLSCPHEFDRDGDYGVPTCRYCGVKETDSIDRLIKLLGDTPVQIGLRQQGHFETVKRMLVDGKTWDEIGKQIGWVGSAVEQWFEMESTDETLWKLWWALDLCLNLLDTTELADYPPLLHAQMIRESCREQCVPKG